MTSDDIADLLYRGKRKAKVEPAPEPVRDGLEDLFGPITAPEPPRVNVLAGLGRPPRQRDGETREEFVARRDRYIQIADEQRAELTALAAEQGLPVTEKWTSRSAWARNRIDFGEEGPLVVEDDPDPVPDTGERSWVDPFTPSE